MGQAINFAPPAFHLLQSMFWFKIIVAAARACLVAIALLGVSSFPIWAQDTVRLVDFEGDVLPILRARCTECHQGVEAKNDFQVLSKEAVLGFVDESGAANSSLWTDYLLAPTKEEDPESLIMPPKGRLSTLELATLKLWLDEGASWPDDVKLDDTGVVPAAPASLSGAAKYLAAAGFFHPAVVHFPIALIIFAALAVLVSYLGGGDGAKKVAAVCFVFGALTTVVSAVAGWGFATEKGYVNTSLFPTEGMSDSAALLYRHRWFGVGAAIVTTVVALMVMASQRKSASGHFWRIGVLGCALLISIVGHQGGELVYGDILHKAMERLGWQEEKVEATQGQK